MHVASPGARVPCPSVELSCCTSSPTSARCSRAPCSRRRIISHVQILLETTNSSDPVRAPSSSTTNSSSTGAPLLLDTLRNSFKEHGAAPVSKLKTGPRICVLGAGVNGLATTVRLLEALPAADITVYANRFGTDVTTHGAAGVWMPYKLSNTPEKLTQRWGQETFNHLLDLVHSDQAVQAGVQWSYCHSLFLAPEPNPFWASTVHGFNRMSQQELELFSRPVDWLSIQGTAKAVENGDVETGPGSAHNANWPPTAFVDGYTFNTVVCEGRHYMRWLNHKLDRAGVHQVQRKLTSLANIADEGWDLVINCCGLGCRRMLPDGQCYPIRGQIMRVKAPWVNQCVFAHFPDETSYIIPNRDFVVLGGTGQIGNHSTEVSLADAERIVDRAIQVLPSLKHAELLDHWVGFRPGRSSLRLDTEVITAAMLQAALEANQAATAAAAAAAAAGTGHTTSTPPPSAATAAKQGHSIGGFLSGRKTSNREGKLRDMRVVHNYGHGGSGLTLAWGTAGDAVQLALQMLGYAADKQQQLLLARLPC